MTTQERVLSDFAAALQRSAQRLFSGAPQLDVVFESPRRPEFGDFATNVAFSLTRHARRSPQEIAQTLIADVQRDDEAASAFAGIEAVAGFINVRLGASVWRSAVCEILRGDASLQQERRTRISLEFGSANPTGPLVVVQGRTCSIGATLANAMRACGNDVFVEWIINDAGGQMETLGRSVYARYRQINDPSFPFPDDGYPGDYLIPIAEELFAQDGDRWYAADENVAIETFARYARDTLVARQMRTIERFGVHYDLWQSEAEMHETGRIRAGIDRLREGGHTYESDGALFFRATDFGDDKDRVLVRRDGRPTYFANDVAYHFEKLQRADKVIDILGPDHHGYIGRLKGLAQALGFAAENLEVLIAQQITLMRGDEQVSMSKRAGHIVTLDDILDEVGVDAARFFFVMLAPESPLTFDLKLAKEQSNDNPVYYVQYSHARICSVLKNAMPEDVAAASDGSVDELASPAEVALIRRLCEMPSVVRNVAEQLAPHRLTRYAREIASDFHQFYHESRILTDDAAVRRSRLALCLATQKVLAQVLAMIGVSAPSSM